MIYVPCATTAELLVTKVLSSVGGIKLVYENNQLSDTFDKDRDHWNDDDATWLSEDSTADSATVHKIFFMSHVQRVLNY